MSDRDPPERKRGKKRRWECPKCGGNHLGVDCEVRFCTSCRKAGHVKRDCPDVECYMCGSRGHTQWKCSKRRATPARSRRGGANASSSSEGASAGSEGPGTSTRSTDQVKEGSVGTLQAAPVPRTFGARSGDYLSFAGIVGGGLRKELPGDATASGPRPMEQSYGEKLNHFLSGLRTEGLFPPPDYTSSLGELDAREQAYEEEVARTRARFAEEHSRLRRDHEEYGGLTTLMAQLVEAARPGTSGRTGGSSATLEQEVATDASEPTPTAVVAGVTGPVHTPVSGESSTVVAERPRAEPTFVSTWTRRLPSTGSRKVAAMRRQR
jgi:hypothetical protein